MKSLNDAAIIEQEIGSTREETAVDPMWTGHAITPQGALRNLSELRADFPNLEVLPRMSSMVTLLPLNGTIDFDLPDFAEFIIIQSQAICLVSFEGRANKPAANEKLTGSYVNNPGNILRYFCAGSKQLSITDLSGANNYVSVQWYVTDRFTVA